MVPLSSSSRSTHMVLTHQEVLFGKLEENSDWQAISDVFQEIVTPARQDPSLFVSLMIKNADNVKKQMTSIRSKLVGNVFTSLSSICPALGGVGNSLVPVFFETACKVSTSKTAAISTPACLFLSLVGQHCFSSDSMDTVKPIIETHKNGLVRAAALTGLASFIKTCASKDYYASDVFASIAKTNIRHKEASCRTALRKLLEEISKGDKTKFDEILQLAGKDVSSSFAPTKISKTARPSMKEMIAQRKAEAAKLKKASAYDEPAPKVSEKAESDIFPVPVVPDETSTQAVSHPTVSVKRKKRRISSVSHRDPYFLRSKLKKPSKRRVSL